VARIQRKKGDIENSREPSTRRGTVQEQTSQTQKKGSLCPRATSPCLAMSGNIQGGGAPLSRRSIRGESRRDARQLGHRVPPEAGTCTDPSAKRGAKTLISRAKKRQPKGEKRRPPSLANRPDHPAALKKHREGSNQGNGPKKKEVRQTVSRG